MATYTSKSLKFTSGGNVYICDPISKLTKADITDLGIPGEIPDVVLEYASRNNFPGTGSEGKVYIAKDTSIIYRWDETESDYIKISDPKNAILTKIAFNIQTSDWTGSDALGYTATISNEAITAGSDEFITYTSSMENLASNISTAKTSTNDGIIFSASKMPVGEVAGHIYSIKNPDGEVAITFVNDQIPINRGGTGATTAAGALSNLGAIPVATKGAANGVASLDSSAKVPIAQLPNDPTKINAPSGGNGTSGQILRTNGDGTTRWDNAATQEEIGTAVTNWLDTNVPIGETVVVDRSLSVSGAAADAAKVGEIKSALFDIANNSCDSKVFPSDFTAVNDNSITYSTDAETGEITVTNGSTSTYACLQTPDTWASANLVAGRTYIVHANAVKVSGSPNMNIAIRGVDGNVNGTAKRVDLNSGENFISFVADQYMKRVTLFVAFGSSTKNSVSKFSDIWIKEFNTMGIDYIARNDIEKTNMFLANDSITDTIINKIRTFDESISVGTKKKYVNCRREIITVASTGTGDTTYVNVNITGSAISARTGDHSNFTVENADFAPTSVFMAYANNKYPLIFQIAKVTTDNVSGYITLIARKEGAITTRKRLLTSFNDTATPARINLLDHFGDADEFALYIGLTNSSYCAGKFAMSFEREYDDTSLVEWDRTKKIKQIDLESGGFTSSGLDDTTKRIRMKNTLFCSKGTRLGFSIGALYYNVFELSSDSRAGGNVLRNPGWSNAQTYTIQNDCYLLVTFANASTAGSSTSISVSDFDTTYFIQVMNAEPGQTLAEFAKEYNKLNDTETLGKVNAYAAELIGKTAIESFMFFTDSHWLNDAQWKDELTFALTEMGGVYNVAPVDFCIYGGDALSGTSPYNEMTKAQAIAYLTIQDQMSKEVFGNASYYPLIGNHDFNYQATNAALTLQDIENAWYRKQGKAYYKIKGNNTTIYCLNTGMNLQSGHGYDVVMDDYMWSQIDWLANDLIENNPTHAMIAMHIIRNNRSQSDPSARPEFCLYTEANELCAAFNSHTSITKNEQTYNFTNCTGKVELFLGGHIHADSKLVDDAQVAYGIKNGIAYVTRTTAKNTISPTYDLVLCDWANHTALFKRFGTGSDALFDLTTGTIITDEEEP